MTNSETNPYPEAIHVPKGRKYKWATHVRKQEIKLGDWAADSLDKAVDFPEFLRAKIETAGKSSDYSEGYLNGLVDALKAFESQD